jgi:hypothetical protein
MKIKLSKSQWEGIGKKAGWVKIARKLIKIDNDIESERTVYLYDDGSKK